MFSYLTEYIPNNLIDGQFRVIYTKPLIKFTFSEEWIEIFVEKYKVENANFLIF